MGRADSFKDGIHYSYDSPDFGMSQHRIRARDPNQTTRFVKDKLTGRLRPMHPIVGELSWNRHHVSGVAVADEYQRRGIATEMWEKAHRVAAEVQKVPKPKHSADRTPAGDAWARAVGGPLPRKLTIQGGYVGDWEPA